MGIRIQIPNKSYVWLKGEIENKNQFNKMTKKLKEWGSKLT